MPLNAPDIKELQAIVDWVNLTDDVREISIKLDGVELFISRNGQKLPGIQGSAGPVTAFTPAAPAGDASVSSATVDLPVALPSATPPAISGTEFAADEVVVKAPMVGTFYASSKPGAPTFVALGDSVKAGSVLCIVEVMKLMNNIEAPVDGTISQILVEDNEAVEYGQPLFAIKRKS